MYFPHLKNLTDIEIAVSSSAELDEVMRTHLDATMQKLNSPAWAEFPLDGVTVKIELFVNPQDDNHARLHYLEGTIETFTVSWGEIGSVIIALTNPLPAWTNLFILVTRGRDGQWKVDDEIVGIPTVYGPDGELIELDAEDHFLNQSVPVQFANFTR